MTAMMRRLYAKRSGVLIAICSGQECGAAGCSSASGRYAFSGQGQARQNPLRSHDPMAQRLIEAYLALAGHAADAGGPVFRPVTNNRTGELDRPLDGRSVYDNVVRKYARETGVSAKIDGLCVHSVHATAATNALENAADIAKVQKWLGPAKIATTRLYDRCKMRPEDSPTATTD
jgi:integrase/recombinase XerD